jgi:anhydro-N-acetylmuramic acid kinase
MKVLFVSQLFIGLLSGTSLDGIDAALVNFATKQPQVLATHCQQWQADIRQRLLHCSQQAPSAINFAELAQLDIEAADNFAAAVQVLLQKAQMPADAVTAIGHPGQTVCHQPLAARPYTWQLGHAAHLAHRSNIPVVSGLRDSDMAAGGQGAPLAPALHAAYLRASDETRIVLNLGGIANITVLPAAAESPVLGFDTGPANALLDAWSWQHRQLAYDAGGAWAAQGTVDEALLHDLCNDPYFRLTAPKSTGRDYFNLAWLNRLGGGRVEQLDPVTVQATLAALTVRTVADAIRPYRPQRVLVCGGGVHNQHLLAKLQAALSSCVVTSTADYGLLPDWVEAICFAWFAYQRWHQQAVDLTTITGARYPTVLGRLEIPPFRLS